MHNKMLNSLAQRLFILTDIKIQRFFLSDEEAQQARGRNDGLDKQGQAPQGTATAAGKQPGRAQSAGTDPRGSDLAQIEDNKTVSDMFNFQSNQLIVSCDF